MRFHSGSFGILADARAADFGFAFTTGFDFAAFAFERDAAFGEDLDEDFGDDLRSAEAERAGMAFQTRFEATFES